MKDFFQDKINKIIMGNLAIGAIAISTESVIAMVLFLAMCCFMLSQLAAGNSRPVGPRG